MSEKNSGLDSRVVLQGLCFVACFAILPGSPVLARDIHWVHLTSKNGNLPIPGKSPEHTGLLVARLDKSSPATDYVLSFRVMPPALVWYRRIGNGWSRYVIDPNFLTVGAGGARQQHDQIFADIEGTGKPPLIFWNQQAKTLFLAEIPPDPRHSGPWPLHVVFSGQAGEGGQNAAKYAEGQDVFDVDGDGRPDLLAGNYWFKYQGAGKFKPGKNAQVVIAPGDGSGPLMFYECTGDPADSSSWKGRNLLGRDMIHGHALDLGDVDGDGNLDIFAAEMGRWTTKPGIDNPNATAWILYGDGHGHFRKTFLDKGEGWHEGKLADVDGDGDLDIIDKPYSWDTTRIDVWLNNGAGPAHSRHPKHAPS